MKSMGALRLKVLVLGCLMVIGATCFTPAWAATLNVGPGETYATIQAAINAASPGDTIQVAAGNYAAGANLNKPLTLLGAQAGVDARDGRPGAIESVITVAGRIFDLNAANITIDGFKFSNLKGRALDTYYDADNFTMRNCILAGSSIDPGYNTGAIQFGGGQNLHANGLLFEQNLVTADNGQLFYMGHAMDNGTIRNNNFYGDSVSFGPFGERTGWLIEGNEFNGDVPGHGAYWGFGFNANLGDVIIRNNIVSKMNCGIGQISVVGGSITGNTFDDNLNAAFQLWGGEWGTVVSGNVLIENNKFSYNGTNGTTPSTASHAIRLRPSPDASTIHMHLNSFENLSLGAGWAIRQNGFNAVDATLNWWGTTDPTVIATMFGEGPVNFKPWLFSYLDDPTMAGQPGFWPILSVSSDVPAIAKLIISDQLAAMVPTLSSDKDQKKLLDVIKHLTKSLEADRWLDNSHPDKSVVFNEEKEAVKGLKELRDGNKSGIDSAVFQTYIDGILAVDRNLAEIAIAEAEAGGGNSNKIQKAQEELLKGDEEAGKDHPDKAIDQYRNAWEKAVKA